jgi:hypothetical protein
MKKIVVIIEGGNAYLEEIEDGITLILRDMDVKVQETYICENDVMNVFTQQLDENGNVIETAEENGE